MYVSLGSIISKSPTEKIGDEAFSTLPLTRATWLALTTFRLEELTGSKPRVRDILEVFL